MHLQLIRVSILGLLALGMCSPAFAEAAVLRPGSKELNTSRLQPFQAIYDVRVEGAVRGQQGKQLSETTLLDAAGLRYVSTVTHGSTAVEEVQLMKESLQPVVRNVTFLPMGVRVEFWQDAELKGFDIDREGSQAESITIPVDGSRFDFASSFLVLASLPLAEGFEAKIPMIISDLGPERANVVRAIKVRGQEKITLRNGAVYSTWVVDSKVADPSGEAVFPPQKYWISDRPPYLIRFDLGPRRSELAEVKM
ncbi:MAG: hypothetical protein AAF657_21080 [Acidobacteriota bacterium]